jgi:hypothetical protein
MKTKHENTLQCSLLVALAIMISVGAIMAQGWAGSNYLRDHDMRKPPPLALPVAYKLALGQLGDVTNRFHCVSATCLTGTNLWSNGWVFTFSNTNGDHAQVNVYFTGTLGIDPKSRTLLR